MIGDDADKTLQLAAKITAAYVKGNKLAPEKVSAFLEDIHHTLTELATPVIRPEDQPQPQYSIADSVTDEVIYCLEDGQPFKSLKRHLRTKYNLTPDAYREKWGLPRDYPMVAPAYARERAKIARLSGLGRGKS
jgi:predicted transcriptional regulator